MKNLLTFLATFAIVGAVLAAVTAPTITTNPTSITKNAGESVTFTAAATGATSVRWEQSTDGGTTWSVVSGATTDSLTFTTTATQDGYQYRATYFNTSGTESAQSTTTAATLTVLSAPVITLQPKSVTIPTGQTYTLAASAIGNPTPTVQWQVSTNSGSSWTDISGATADTYAVTTSASISGYQYRAVYTNSKGSTATSAATITISSDTSGGGGGTGSGSAYANSTNGVLVYDLNFKHLAGFGVDFFEDGYVIVPATGGDGQVIFLGREHGARFYSKQTGVKSFPAKTRSDKFSVITMNGTTGAIVSMQAYGKADDKIKAVGPNYSLTVHAPKTMHGLAQAALDESASTTVPANGTLGFVEFAEMKLSLNEKETETANKKVRSVADEATALETEVKQRGYTALPAATTTTTNTATDTATDTSSTTNTSTAK